MTIDKAIKVLGLMGVDIKYWKDDEGEKALKLGIEALKRIKHLRPNANYAHATLLPGETEE